jgi:hypothetical protein
MYASTYKSIYGPHNNRGHEFNSVSGIKAKTPAAISFVVEPLHGTIVNVLKAGGFLSTRQEHRRPGAMINCFMFYLVNSRGFTVGQFYRQTVEKWARRGLLVRQGDRYVLPPHD